MLHKRFRQSVLGILSILMVMRLGQAKIIMAAGEKYDSQKGEVVFLLDTSISMNDQDKKCDTMEAIRQTMYSLPSDYQVGLVAYNTGIQTMIPLSSGVEVLDRQLDFIPYAGYTNAGEGLQKAVEMFSDGKGVERSIFLLTDGEIDMPDQQQKENSRSLYEEAAAKAAQQKIRIYIIAIGSELGNPQMHIFDGAEVTKGAVYWEGQSGSLAEILERILTERMRIPLKNVKVTVTAGEEVNMAGEVGGEGDGSQAGDIMTLELPEKASHIRLLLISDGEMEPFSIECKSENQDIIRGRSFAVVDLVRPVSDQAGIRFQTENSVDSGRESRQKKSVSQEEYPVRICMLTEYAACIQVETEYECREIERTEEEVKKKIPPRYDHLAHITIRAVDQEDGSVSLWDREELEGKEISYTLNGETCQGVIEKGRIRTSIPADGVEEVEVLLDFGGLGDVWQVRQADPVRIERTPDPVFSPEPDYRPLWGILGILISLLVFLGLWERRKNTTILYMDHIRPGDESGNTLVLRDTPYSGKFNLYLVRSRDGKDFPPQEYRLFGHTSGRISLKQILDSCRIYYGERESGDIIFCPGPEHSVLLSDQSDRCTVMRGAEILKKGRGYPIYYNEKITITFYEEDTELELHYRNLKPSERENLG